MQAHTKQLLIYLSKEAQRSQGDPGINKTVRRPAAPGSRAVDLSPSWYNKVWPFQPRVQSPYRPRDYAVPGSQGKDFGKWLQRSELGTNLQHERQYNQYQRRINEEALQRAEAEGVDITTDKGQARYAEIAKDIGTRIIQPDIEARKGLTGRGSVEYAEGLADVGKAHTEMPEVVRRARAPEAPDITSLALRSDLPSLAQEKFEKTMPGQFASEMSTIGDRTKKEVAARRKEMLKKWMPWILGAVGLGIGGMMMGGGRSRQQQPIIVNHGGGAGQMPWWHNSRWRG